MQLKPLSNSAMTLAELIIASILVGIVTLGLVAAEQAVRMSRQSSNRDSQISAQLQAAMTRLSQQAGATVGDYSDTGIYQYADANFQAICFRYSYGNANNYSDDEWNCWNVDMSTGLLKNCENTVGPPNSCSEGRTYIPVPWVQLKFDTTTYTTFFNVVDDAGESILPPSSGSGEIIANKKIAYIDIQLKSCFNPDAAAHPIENPEYTLTSRISPVGLSR